LDFEEAMEMRATEMNPLSHRDDTPIRQPMTVGRRSARTQKLSILFGLFGLCLLLGSCSPRAFDWPSVSSDGWTVYQNEAVGYRIQVPRICEVEEHHDGRTVLFRFRGAPIIAVNFVDEAEGDARGLWVGHDPIDDVELAGRPGMRYLYDHWDGPFGMRTVSYVVPHRDRLFGLELRTGAAQPTEIQQTILDSLTFES